MNPAASFLALSLLSSAVVAQDPLFGRRHRMTPDSIFIEDTALADFSGDGVLDLFLDLFSAVEVWKGGPDGAFDELLWSAPSESYYEFGYALLDVEGDGDLDIAGARNGYCYFTCSEAANKLFLNDGSGVFTEASGHFPANDDYPNRFALSGDLDGDGDHDLVFGGAEHCWVDAFGHSICQTSEALVWRNDGLGFFTDVPGALSLPGEIDVGLCADFSGDGAAELLLGFDGQKALYENDGTGSFTADFLAVGPQPFSHDLRMVSALDADLDGDLDAVATYEYSGTAQAARLFLNDGAGSLPWDSSELSYPAQVHAVLDYEQDGDPDLVLGGTSLAWRLANDGTGHFVELGALADYGPTLAFAAGDVDLDGDDDLLLNAELYLGDGAGELARAEPIPLPTGGYERRQALLDLEGDGDLDVAIANTGTVLTDLYRNDGAGHFESAPGGVFEQQESAAVALIAADLDADGDPDLASAFNSSVALARVYRNTLGSFDASATLPGSASTSSLAAADVNGDGAVDLALGKSLAANLLYLGTGGGGFAAAPGFLPAISSATRSLHFVDFDGDGDPDLVEAVDGEDHLYRNDGVGFTDVPSLLPSNPGWTIGYAAGDVDQDGDVDLMAGNYSMSVPVANRLFLNSGAAFVDATSSLSPADARTTDLALDDFDEDGDLDALWAVADGSPMVLANDGAAFFAHVPLAADDVSTLTRTIETADFDGDGDTDLFASSILSNRVHFNLSGQLAWHSLPRVGKPLVFELDGAAGAF